MRTLKYFMWSYQQSFHIALRLQAERIFDKLDPKLQPSVFLVGILEEDRPDRHPVCIEPEDCGYEVEWFSKVKERSVHFEALDTENNIIQSHPKVQEIQNQRIKLRALKSAILEVLQLYYWSESKESFCSWPVMVDGFQVCVIIQFESQTFCSHYSLAKESYGPSYRKYIIAKSLLDAAVREFLISCVETLRKPNAGEGFSEFERNPDEIITSAGNLLMETPASACEDVMGLRGLFDACNIISSLRYESSESVGSIIISNKNHPNIETIIEFTSPIRLRDYSAVRKVLETSDRNYSLLTNSVSVYGLGRIVGNYDQKQEDLFMVRFISHYKWELVHANHRLMVVEYREPRLPRSVIDEEKFRTDFVRIFGEIEASRVDEIWRLILEATKQLHGTMIVISNDAEEEANRLQEQCMRIKPIHLALDMINLVTAIDGAVLISPDAKCYAIGVILDGLASPNATPSRGARYNSAIRYVDSNNGCFVVVISEDGKIDLIPDLIPQIRRTEIENAISELRAMKGSPNATRKTFYKLYDWFCEHIFYLSQEMCAEVNGLFREVESQVIETGSVRRVLQDFVPNDEMNDSYFLDE